MIKKEEVQRIAQLARLGLTEAEIKKYQKELTAILDYFNKLKEVVIPPGESLRSVIKNTNVMRDDLAVKFENLAEQLLKLAPAKKNNYLRVKSVF
ncbi:MAG: Asp-tRNA(Asn)/Glu-tRNA(Gln) amidotransferase subunit GatC [Minisyncoccales bacterium]